MKIILASGSPRRRELLEQAGYEFEIEVSDADENIQANDPGELVEQLSFRKADAVARKHLQEQACTVIGADTVVVLDREVLGKPNGEQGAVEMLKELSGRTHQVYTGVSLFLIKDGKLTASQSFHVCTDVTMRPMSDREIADYVATGEPMDKAGAYGIQGKAAVFISGIHGDYYNVVGLPVCETVQQLQGLWNRYNS